MGVKLQSALGGSVELNAPSTASNFTMTVPAGNGTVATTDQLAGFRNRIINGDMRIDQRNAGQAISAANAENRYLIDRWVYYTNTTGRINFGRNQGGAAPPVGFSNYMNCNVISAVTPGASDYWDLDQVIEGANIEDLAWGTSNAKTATLSFWVRCSLTGTFGGAINNYAYNRSYTFSYSIPTANTWTRISIVIPGDTTGTWPTGTVGSLRVRFSLGDGANKISPAANTWHALGRNVPPGCVNLVANAGAQFNITGVQFEKGSSATEFEGRLVGTELYLCQRYYETTYAPGVKPGSSSVDGGIALGALSSYLYYTSSVAFKVPKRATPSIIIYALNGVANNSSEYDQGTSFISNKAITLSGPTNGAGVNGFGIYQYGNATAGWLYAFHYAADADM